MDRPTGFGGRWRKPLVVGGLVFVLPISIGLIYFQSVGILSRSREYPHLLEEAKSIGIPMSEEALRQDMVSGKKNLFPEVHKCMTEMTAAAGSNRFYLEPAKKASPDFQWKPTTRALWVKLQPLLDPLADSALTDAVVVSDTSQWQFQYQTMTLQNLSTIRALASSHARAGNFAEAERLFVLDAALIRWRSGSNGSIWSMSIGDQVNLANDVIAFVAANPNSPELRRAVRSVCTIALKPFNFAEMYCENLQFYVFDMDRKGWKPQWLSPTNPFGRSILWMNIPIVRQATKSDLLRSYLAGYRMVKADPMSLDLGGKAGATIRAELAKSNPLTRELAQMFGPYNFVPRVKTFVTRLEAILKRFS